MADGNEAAKYFTTTAINDSDWHHGACRLMKLPNHFGWTVNRRVLKDMQVDQVHKELFLLMWKRWTFSQSVNMNSNVTSFLTGNIDDFYVFDRILTQAEISFLYNLQQGREQVPRLEAVVVDAVGSIILIDNGDGYKEQPEAFFSYGGDGEFNSSLIDARKFRFQLQRIGSHPRCVFSW